MCRSFWQVLSRTVACGLLGTQFVLAQPSPNAQVPAPPAPRTDVAKSALPPLPPVDFFRQLVAMKPEDRARALASKPEPQRQSLHAKALEYAKLPEEERESRLQLLQLYLYLPALIKLPPGDRIERVNALRPEDRKLIEERLERWDRLPRDLQKEILEHEKALLYFLGVEGDANPQPRDTHALPVPEEYRQLDQRLEQWRALPTDRREKMYKHFRAFFELPARQKETTLKALSEAERQQMEKSLQAFDRLTPEQRRMCIESFQQFANMNKGERDQFLKNAERWESMSPSERTTWRNLVGLFPQPRPPMPPGFAPTTRLPGEQPVTGAATNKLPKLPGEK